jgi:hypothetical protein
MVEVVVADECSEWTMVVVKTGTKWKLSKIVWRIHV